MERSKRVKYSKFHKILLALGVGIILLTVGYLMFMWGELPDKVPTHFGATGEVDGFGSRGSLIVIPIIQILLFLTLAIITRFPRAFNFSVEITKENEERQYNNAISLLLILNVEMCSVFSYITYKAVLGARDGSASLGAWFLLVELGIIFSTIGYFIYKMVKLK